MAEESGEVSGVAVLDLLFVRFDEIMELLYPEGTSKNEEEEEEEEEEEGLA